MSTLIDDTAEQKDCAQITVWLEVRVLPAPVQFVVQR
jgi:hypothetical protein